MYQDEALFSEAFAGIILNYEKSSISDFLKASFLIPEDVHITTDPFTKKIYMYGDSNEIYTKLERDFIDSFEENIFTYESSCVANEEETVTCRLIVSYMDNNQNELFNSILFMKIINKAFDGFNSFVFVNRTGLRIGCTLLNSKHDCAISPLISRDINSDFLFNVFLYRNNSDNFREYYFNYLTMIDSLKYCFFNNDSSENFMKTYSLLDDNIFEDGTCFDVREFIASIPSELADEAEEYVSEYERYLELVEECFDDLSKIKKNRTNSLELLFEAEESIKLSTENQEPEQLMFFQESEIQDDEDLDLLDNPMQLLKKLKKDNGIL